MTEKYDAYYDHPGSTCQYPGHMKLQYPNGEFNYLPVGTRLFIENGELCRAAHAGGECQHEWQPDADVMNARYCPKCDVTQMLPRKSTKDSAPAGSGEVEALVKLWRDRAAREDEDGNPYETQQSEMRLRLCADELEALLRKLQQGADYFYIEHACPECNGDPAACRNNHASQGQEGGHE